MFDSLFLLSFFELIQYECQTKICTRSWYPASRSCNLPCQYPYSPFQITIPLLPYRQLNYKSCIILFNNYNQSQNSSKSEVLHREDNFSFEIQMRNFFINVYKLDNLDSYFYLKDSNYRLNVGSQIVKSHSLLSVPYA